MMHQDTSHSYPHFSPYLPTHTQTHTPPRVPPTPLLFDRRENGEIIYLLNLSTTVDYLQPTKIIEMKKNTNSIFLPSNYSTFTNSSYLKSCFLPLHYQEEGEERQSLSSEIYTNYYYKTCFYENQYSLQERMYTTQEHEKRVHTNIEVRDMKNKSKTMTSTSSSSSSIGKFICCSKAKCENRARSKGLCKRHGGGTRCSEPLCDRPAQRQGKCPRHGGASKCTVPNCTKFSQSMGRCKAHGGGTLCAANGCTKNAYQNKMCRTHGGGSRCKLYGCNKWAQKLGFCCSHTKLHATTDAITYSV